MQQRQSGIGRTHRQFALYVCRTRGSSALGAVGGEARAGAYANALPARTRTSWQRGSRRLSRWTPPHSEQIEAQQHAGSSQQAAPQPVEDLRQLALLLLARV